MDNNATHMVKKDPAEEEAGMTALLDAADILFPPSHEKCVVSKRSQYLAAKRKKGTQSLLPISFIKDPTKKSCDKHRRHASYRKKKVAESKHGRSHKIQKKRRKTPAGTRRFIEYMKQQCGDDIEAFEEGSLQDSPVTTDVDFSSDLSGDEE